MFFFTDLISGFLFAFFSQFNYDESRCVFLLGLSFWEFGLLLKSVGLCLLSNLGNLGIHNSLISSSTFSALLSFSSPSRILMTVIVYLYHSPRRPWGYFFFSLSVVKLNNFEDCSTFKFTDFMLCSDVESPVSLVFWLLYFSVPNFSFASSQLQLIF